jgi:hypothetical protein
LGDAPVSANTTIFALQKFDFLSFQFSKWRKIIFVGYALGCIGLTLALTNIIFIGVDWD